MYNQFRTLLLNLPYAGDGAEHIPSTFNGVILPSVLLSIYNILFPANTSRYYKNFLAQNYLQIIASAGLSDVFTTLDPRISYDIDSNEYFKIYRTSNPIVSDVTSPIFISGQYNNIASNNYYYDNFLISQIGSSNNIVVYSTINNVYLNGINTFLSPDNAHISVTFNNGVSEPVLIGRTGLSFTLGGGNTFSDGSGRTWSFIAEAPYVFNFNAIMSALSNNPNVAALFNYHPAVDVTTYSNLFNYNFNTVYQLAGLLVAYVLKCNSLL